MRMKRTNVVLDERLLEEAVKVSGERHRTAPAGGPGAADRAAAYGRGEAIMKSPDPAFTCVERLVPASASLGHLAYGCFETAS